MIIDIILLIIICVVIGRTAEYIYGKFNIYCIKCKGCGTKIVSKYKSDISESELANIYNYTIIDNKYYCPTCVNVQVRRKIIDAGI